MSSIKRNAMSLLLSQGATWMASILLLVLVPVEVGAQEYGELVFAVVYVSLFGLLANYGTDTFLTKTLARDPEQAGHYMFNTLLMKLLASLTLSGVAIGLAAALGFDGQRLVLIAVCCIGMVFGALNSVLVGGYQALQRMGRPAFWNAVNLYVGSFTGLIVLFSGGGIVGFALAFNLAGSIPLMANAFGLGTELRTHSGPDRQVWKRVITGGFPFFVMSGLLAVSGSVDIPMIQAFAGAESVGWYGLAYRWVSMPAFFAAAVATAFFPALSREGVALSEEFTAMANRAIYIVLLVAVPGAVGIALIARDFIALLYGSDFQPAVPLIQILALHIPVVGLDIVLGVVVVAADRQRQWVIFSAVAAILNPLANLFAIPFAMERFDNGAVGAAFTTVLTEMVLLAGALYIRPKGVFDRRTSSLVSRIVLASAAMVPVVLVLGSAPLYVQIPMGAFAYAIGSLLLKTVSIDEVRNLRSEFSSRGAG